MAGPFDTRPRWGEVGIHGVHRLREWDAVTVVEAPGLEGEELERVVLRGGDHPLERALQGSVEPPYRLRAVRKGPDRWAVGVRRIEVVELPGVSGAELVLTVRNGERSLVVDGLPTVAPLEPLERAAGYRHTHYVAQAERLEGDLWELRVTAL